MMFSFLRDADLQSQDPRSDPLESLQGSRKKTWLIKSNQYANTLDEDKNEAVPGFGCARIEGPARSPANPEQIPG
jgi:hypothetical protein